MLYPKIRVKKKEKKPHSKVKYLKEKILSFLKIFKSYNSFVMFFKKKFHF